MRPLLPRPRVGRPANALQPLLRRTGAAVAAVAVQAVARGADAPFPAHGEESIAVV